MGEIAPQIDLLRGRFARSRSGLIEALGELGGREQITAALQNQEAGVFLVRLSERNDGLAIRIAKTHAIRAHTEEVQPPVPRPYGTLRSPPVPRVRYALPVGRERCVHTAADAVARMVAFW